MSTPTQSGPHSLALTLREWARTDGLVWVFVFKTVLAALLSLLIAMQLDLPQPRTAITTVFIVMLPQSGMVIAKSFYRFCGTLVGLVVTLALVALFAQQRVLFLVTMALWIGFCTAGAARNRNLRSYGFVLAGYTTALIGIPAAQHPDGVFILAMTRVAEITVGIVCSGLTSALVFPQYAGTQMDRAIDERFGKFIQYVTRSLAGKTTRLDTESTISSFVTDIVGFETIRSVAVFEKPDIRLKTGRLSRFNSEFMAVSTRFHALHLLANRLRDRTQSAILDALNPYFDELSSLLSNPLRSGLNAHNVAELGNTLESLKQSLSMRFQSTRLELAQVPSESLLELDTAVDLLYRFVDDLCAYTLTYGSLMVPTHQREDRVDHYEPRTSALAATISGLRAIAVTLCAAVFWIESAWPSGGVMVFIAAAIGALVSSSPSPSRTAIQMAIGSVLAAIAGEVVTFVLYPRLDGFILLAATLAPFLMAGAYLSTRKHVAGIGIGYNIFFCFLAGPDNVVQYDPYGYFNTAIAVTAGICAVALAYSTIFPTDASWLRLVLLRKLRHQVVGATSHSLGRGRIRFESGSRDLLWQINALSEAKPELRRDTLRWFFSVLEVGHAILDLRLEIRDADTDKAAAQLIEDRTFKQALNETLRAVSSLFASPSTSNLHQALKLTGNSIELLSHLLREAHSNADGRSLVLRMRSHLHFVRTALLEPESPFVKYLLPGESTMPASTKKN